MANIDALFEPLSIGRLTLKNRMVFAPCTRQRSYLDGTVTDLNVEYYRQRAGAGLLITEGVYPSEMGNGYLFMPGLSSDAHAKSWRHVTDAVHEKGGAIFAQILHVGRLADALSLPNHAQPIAPSAVQPDPYARHYTINSPRAKRPYQMPRALTTPEVYGVIEDFKRSTEFAQAAGFDGVEIHGGSGYLPMQFLSTNANLREDEFGGSVENRSRFILECVDAMIGVSSSDYVAVKISPGWTYHDVFDEDPIATYTYLVPELSRRSIAYLQLGNFGVDFDVYGTLSPLFDGLKMGVAGFNRTSAAEAISAKDLDLVAFGQSFIANPDLVDRFRNGWPLNQSDPGKFYTQGAEGYTDYPFYDPAHVADRDLIDVDSTMMPPKTGVSGSLAS